MVITDATEEGKDQTVRKIQPVIKLKDLLQISIKNLEVDIRGQNGMWTSQKKTVKLLKIKTEAHEVCVQFNEKKRQLLEV